MGLTYHCTSNWILGSHVASWLEMINISLDHENVWAPEQPAKLPPHLQFELLRHLWDVRHGLRVDSSTEKIVATSNKVCILE